MARRPAPSHAPKPKPLTRRDRFLRLTLSCVYLLALGGLIAWEYRDHLELFSNTCEGLDAPPKSDLYAVPYTWFLDWTHRETSTQVSVVAVPQDLDEIQNNLCESRDYFADLLLAIAPQHPAEIVIDKFYGPTSCASTPQSTQRLIQVVQSLDVPVIIGESTDTSEVQHGAACLITKPQLVFDSPNVHHGLTRLDPDVERIPLQWPVLPEETEGNKSEPHYSDTLAWSAVQSYDQDFAQRARIRKLIASHLEPYARLNAELPRQTSTDLLCSAQNPDVLKRWKVDCSHPRPPASLRGKIVVIGSEKEPDRSIIMGRSMWGFDTQARYIAALLSGSYLHASPIWLSLLLFALFVIVIEGLPILFEVYRPHWKNHPFIAHAFPRRRYRWVIFWTFAFIIGVAIISLLFGFLPPLSLFGDICLVVITRLLFFIAESVEAPLLHHETKGQSHV